MLKIFITLFTSLFYFNFVEAQTEYWQQTNGPYGGNVNAVTINLSGHILAGAGVGIFRSTDNGTHWMQLNGGVRNKNVLSLITDTKGIIFAGTKSAGVYRSTDDGEHWLQINNGLTSFSIQSLAIDSNGTLYAGGIGVFRSTDLGNTWTQTTLTTPSITSLISNSRGHIFAATYSNGIYRSTDGGNFWTQINNGLTSGYVSSLANTSNDILFAGVYDYFGGVFRSTNNGDNWNHVDSSRYVSSITINSKWYIFANVIDRGVIRSTNGGDSWTTTGFYHGRMYLFASNASNYIFAGFADGCFITCLGGLFRSSDEGMNWVQVGIPATMVTALTVNSNGYIFAGTFGDGAFRSTNNGLTWTQMNISGPQVYAFQINPKGYIFVGAEAYQIEAGVLFRSKDNGETWSELHKTFTRAIASNSKGHIFVGTYVSGIYRSTDNGDTWTSVNTGLTNLQVRSLAVNSLDFIYAGTRGSGVFFSIDNGDSWSEINKGLVSNAYIRALAVNLHDYVFTGTDSNGIYRSIGGAEVWTPINHGLTNLHIRSLATGSNGEIFAGTLSGVFRSSDNGEHWTSINIGLPDSIDVRALAISPHGHVLAGTSGSGVFHYLTTLSYNLSSGWNLISIPLTTFDKGKNALFPSAISSAFAFENGYRVRDTLKQGFGYWLKFSSPLVATLSGRLLLEDSINVKRGWNIIGSISYPIPVNTINTIPTGLIASDFYAYDPSVGYMAADTIKPGLGYWVKVKNDGKLILSATNSNHPAAKSKNSFLQK